MYFLVWLLALNIVVMQLDFEYMFEQILGSLKITYVNESQLTFALVYWMSALKRLL